MISEQQQETASLYVLGALLSDEKAAFEAVLRQDPELRALVDELETTVSRLARSIPASAPSPALRQRILQQAGSGSSTPPAVPALQTDAASRPPPRSLSGIDPAFFFVAAADSAGWKALPIPGAYIKLLAANREQGYAVFLGRLEPGVQYPAHLHESPEDIYVLTGDLTIAGERLGPGDFHHCDAGTSHPVNFSDEGCTLLAVLALNHHLAQFAMAPQP